MATMAAVCENFMKIYSHSVSVHILPLLTPAFVHRLLRPHRENLGRGRAAAGRGAERSHERREASCVRLEREVLGVR